MDEAIVVDWVIHEFQGICVEKWLDFAVDFRAQRADFPNCACSYAAISIHIAFYWVNAIAIIIIIIIIVIIFFQFMICYVIFFT